MPYSAYFPEHMGSIKLAPAGPLVAGFHAQFVPHCSASAYGVEEADPDAGSRHNEDHVST